MVFIWRIGGYGMKDSTMIRLTYGVMFLTTFVLVGLKVPPLLLLNLAPLGLPM